MRLGLGLGLTNPRGGGGVVPDFLFDAKNGVYRVGAFSTTTLASLPGYSFTSSRGAGATPVITPGVGYDAAAGETLAVDYTPKPAVDQIILAVATLSATIGTYNCLAEFSNNTALPRLVLLRNGNAATMVFNNRNTPTDLVGATATGVIRVAILFFQRGAIGDGSFASTGMFAKVGSTVTAGPSLAGSLGIGSVTRALIGRGTTLETNNEAKGTVERVEVRLGTFTDAQIITLLGGI